MTDPTALSSNGDGVDGDGDSSNAAGARVAPRPARLPWGVTGSMLALAALLALALPRLVPAAFVIESATTRIDDGVVMLDADIDFAFSDAAREAMNNAVPITVAVEVEVIRKGALWNRRIADLQLRYRIQTHPLSERYVVTHLNSGDARTYRSFAQMLVALGRVSGVPLLDAHLLTPHSRHSVRLRAQLDVEALPSPLRPLAYVSGPWQLASPWTELRLTQ